MSEQNHYKEFNGAMAKFQEEYEPPKKDKKVDFKTKKGDHVKYDYSDLESVQRAIRVAASKHGLSWNVEFESKETTTQNYGKEIPALLTTPTVIINHSSGTQKSFKGIPLYATSLDPQAIGSIKTYAERYALSGAFGIASDEDDDGRVAKDGHDNQKNNKKDYGNSAENNFNKNKDELQSRLNKVADKTGKAYKDLEKYIIDKTNEKLNKNYTNINSQNIGMAVGYVKVLENQANKKEQENKQQSMMQGNTTNPVDWGN